MGQKNKIMISNFFLPEIWLFSFSGSQLFTIKESWIIIDERALNRNGGIFLHFNKHFFD